MCVSLQPIRLPVGGENEHYTLDALKKHVRSNWHHYLNHVKYYNVASDVLLMVAIKEGHKILKGIKHAVPGAGCNAKSADEMRRLGSTLRAFGRAYDALIVAIADKKRIDVAASNPQKEAFDRRAGSVATLLDVPENPDDDLVRRVCGEIAARLGDIGDAYLGGGGGGRPTIDTMKFEAYHFTGPTVNVRELYRFVANSF